jgi:predicted PurR-regulated permease PerM
MDSYRDPNQSQTQPLFQLNLDANNAYYLRSSASWARILGVCGIVMAFLLAAYSVFVLVALSKTYEYGSNRFMDQLTNDNSPESLKGAAAFVMIIALIFFFGGLFSFLFGKRISTALQSNSQEGLNTAFRQLRNYYALRSITMIVVLLFMVIGILGNMGSSN